MHGLIDKLLRKRGLQSVEDLDATPLSDGSLSERHTVENWQAILSKEELTVEDIKKFCESQIDVIEGKWKDLGVENQKKAEMIPYHTVYKTLLSAIDSPKVARAQLEQQLNQLIQ